MCELVHELFVQEQKFFEKTNKIVVDIWIILFLLRLCIKIYPKHVRLGVVISENIFNFLKKENYLIFEKHISSWKTIYDIDMKKDRVCTLHPINKKIQTVFVQASENCKLYRCNI